jgi:hypothetical protein
LVKGSTGVEAFKKLSIDENGFKINFKLFKFFTAATSGEGVWKSGALVRGL